MPLHSLNLLAEFSKFMILMLMFCALRARSFVSMDPPGSC